MIRCIDVAADFDDGFAIQGDGSTRKTWVALKMVNRLAFILRPYLLCVYADSSSSRRERPRSPIRTHPQDAYQYHYHLPRLSYPTRFRRPLR
jgi:hypothetical protein